MAWLGGGKTMALHIPVHVRYQYEITQHVHSLLQCTAVHDG